MKIAIFHELDFGGARRTVDEFVKNLAKTSEVDLYYVDNKEDESIKKFTKNIFFYPFYPKSWKGNNWKIKLYKDTVELLSLYRLHKRIALDVESGQYDYIFVHPSKFTQAPFLLHLLKNKCIYYCQEPLRIAYDKRLSSIAYIKFPKNVYEFLNRRIRRWIDKINFGSANLILANSKFSKEFIKKTYGKSADVCYLGVDTDFFRPLNLNRAIDVLFMGNKDEGYDFLNKLSKFCGNNLKARAIFRESGLSNITDGELVKIYNKSKVLVALNHNEPFGLIPLEAMACGTPVIAVNEGGYRESVIDKKTGFLVSRDSEDLYGKINRIIGNNKLRIIMSKSARENVLQNWTWRKSVEKFLELAGYGK